jgi:hypothetical protein
MTRAGLTGTVVEDPGIGGCVAVGLRPDDLSR